MGKKSDNTKGRSSSKEGKISHTFDPHKKPCAAKVEEDVGIEEVKCHESIRDWHEQMATTKQKVKTKKPDDSLENTMDSASSDECEKQKKAKKCRDNKHKKEKCAPIEHEEECTSSVEDQRYENISKRRRDKNYFVCPQSDETISTGLCDPLGDKSENKANACETSSGTLKTMVCPELRYKVSCQKSAEEVKTSKISCQDSDEVKIDLCGKSRKGSSSASGEPDDCVKTISCDNSSSKTSESKRSSSPKIENTKVSRFQEVENSSCAPPEKNENTNTERTDCQTEKSDPCESPYSKMKGLCKKMANMFIPGSGEKYDSKIEGKHSEKTLSEDCVDKPESSSLPCHPELEKGIPPVQSCCINKHMCPGIKKPTEDEFFCIDARNKALNECIEKYKANPDLVKSKCSQFANWKELEPMRQDQATKPTPVKVIPSEETSKFSKSTVKTSQPEVFEPSTESSKCSEASTKMSEAESERQAQLKCEESPKRSGDIVRSSGKNATAFMLSPTGRQLAGKWAPSAAVYLATAALLTVYVTEWKPVLRYIPGYSSKVTEEEARES